MCVYGQKYTYYTHTYIVMDECMYGHMYVTCISMYIF